MYASRSPMVLFWKSPHLSAVAKRRVFPESEVSPHRCQRPESRPDPNSEVDHPQTGDLRQNGHFFQFESFF